SLMRRSRALSCRHGCVGPGRTLIGHVKGPRPGPPPSSPTSPFGCNILALHRRNVGPAARRAAPSCCPMHHKFHHGADCFTVTLWPPSAERQFVALETPGAKAVTGWAPSILVSELLGSWLRPGRGR